MPEDTAGFSQQELREIIQAYSRRLHKLQVRVAMEGIDARPADRIEIEDIEQKLSALQAQLEPLIDIDMETNPQDVSKGYQREAVLGAISIDQGTCIVSNSKAEYIGGTDGTLRQFGGPGNLIVQEGHAVILEQNGRLSRVVGRGITWLESHERVSMVVPLQTRSERVVVEQVVTKDRFWIEELELMVFHKVDQGPEEDQTENGQYPFSENILLTKVWTMSGGDWRGSIKAVSETAARDVVGRYDLEQILPIAGKPRVDFKDALKREINRVVKGFMGVEVVVVDIGKVRVPEEAKRRLAESGGNAPTQPTLSNELDDEIAAIKRRRLHELRKKQALMGRNTPSEDLIEIEELENKLRENRG